MGGSATKSLSPTVEKGLLNQQVVVSTQQAPIPVDLLRGNYLVVGVYLISVLQFIQILLYILNKYRRGMKNKYLYKSRINVSTV